MAKSPSDADDDKNHPMHEIRHRRIRATIWRNLTTNGPMYAVTVTRAFKKDEVWHDSHTFGFDDILIVAKLLNDAHSYISTVKVKDRVAARPTSSEATPPRKASVSRQRTSSQGRSPDPS